MSWSCGKRFITMNNVERGSIVFFRSSKRNGIAMHISPINDFVHVEL